MILWQPSNSALAPSNIRNVHFTLYHLLRKKIFFVDSPMQSQSHYWHTRAVCFSVKRGVLCTLYSPSSKSVKFNVSQHRKTAVHSKNFLSVVCPWIAVVRLCSAHIWKYWRLNNPLPSTSLSLLYVLHLVQIFRVFTKQEWQLRWIWRPQ
jgi:hypothetical protein